MPMLDLHFLSASQVKLTEERRQDRKSPFSVVRGATGTLLSAPINDASNAVMYLSSKLIHSLGTGSVACFSPVNTYYTFCNFYIRK